MTEPNNDSLPNPDLAGLAEFVPYEGDGGSDLFAFDGVAKVTIKKATPGQSKAGNPTIKFVLIGAEEDTQGLQLVKDVATGGVDKNGEPLVRQLGEVLMSIPGMKLETVKGLAAKKATSQQIVDKFFKAGVVLHARIEKDEYEGKIKSDTKGFVTAAKFEEGAAANTNRKGHGTTPAGKPSKKPAKGAAADAGGLDDLDGDATVPPPKTHQNGAGKKPATTAAADPLDAL